MVWPHGWVPGGAGPPGADHQRDLPARPPLVLVTLRVTDLAWARRLVLGLGPEVTVVAPAALAEAVRMHASAALEAYGTPAGLAIDPSGTG